VNRSLVVLLFCTFALSACRDSASGWKTHVIAYQEQNRTVADANLPRNLWDKITDLIRSQAQVPLGTEKVHSDSTGANEHGGSAGGPTNAAKLGPLPSVFAPIKVYLIEKNHGILTRGNTSIAFASGGGVLDLRDYLQAKNGSFYIAVEFLADKEGADRHVYFLSHAVARKLNGDTYGAGCNTYFDITSAYNKAVNGDGFLVNTSEGRHVSALAGSYFFASAHEGKLYLASLTIKDTRFPALQCDHPKAE
jgi:hypothetical protein